MATLTKKVTLVFADAGSADGGQHNKVWHGELYDDGMVITRWGRIGYDMQSKDFPGAGESFLLKKQSEKIRKGYTEARIISTENTSSLARPVSVSNLHEIAKSQLLKSSSPILDKLIDRLVKSNVHKITSSTNIVLNDATGLFTTPIGIVTPDAVNEARQVLVDILPLVKNQNYGENLNRLTSQYLRLIPQNIGMRFNVRNIFPDETSVQKQEDILQSLEASYQALTSTTKKVDNKPSTTKEEEIFKVDLDIETGNEANRLERWFETSKKTMHGYDRVKVINIYRVKIHSMNDRFFSTDTNKKEVFHGSSMANVLSILKSGLKISPPATAAIAGKLFGNGIYGAIHSTKGLGYCFNKWGQGGVGDAGFLMVCDFALGRCYSTTAYGCSKPNGYDSVWAKSSSGGLYHDEIIVYSENRVNIKYLIECK